MIAKQSAAFLLALAVLTSGMGWAQTKGPVTGTTKSGTPVEKGVVTGSGRREPASRTEVIRPPSVTEQPSAMPTTSAPQRAIPRTTVGSTKPDRKAGTLSPSRRRAKAPAPVRVDERPLWLLLSKKRYDELDAAIARLKRSHPGWSPPARLVALSEEGRRRAAVSSALESQSDRALIDVAQRFPEEFTCKQLDNAWRLAEAYGRAGRLADATRVYSDLLATCPKAEDRMATIYKASEVVSGADFSQLYQYELLNNSRPSTIDREFRRFGYDRQMTRLSALFETQKTAEAVELGRKMADSIRGWKDHKGANLVGWVLYESALYSEAAEWFALAISYDPADSDALYGIALCQFKEGNLGGARLTLLDDGRLSAKQLDERSQTLLGEVYFARATMAYQNKDYDECALFLDKAERLGKADDALMEMRGWQRLSAGQYAESAAIFERLYRTSATESRAEGLSLSLRKLGDKSKLARLEKELGGPLGTIAKAHDFDSYYSKKLFLAAYQADRRRMPELENIDSPEITLGGVYRERMLRDDSPMELKIARLPVAGASAAFGSLALRGGADWVRLKASKVPVAGAFPVGQEPLVPRPYDYGPTESVNGVEPYLGLRYEDILTIDGEVGTTIRKKPLSQEVIWRLMATYYAERSYVSGEFYRQPVRETILSYSGMTDPYTGKVWGQVLRLGGAFTGFWNFGSEGQWNLYARAGYERLTGKNVRSNSHFYGVLGLYRNLDIDGFDYFTIGPDMTYETFRNNQNHYTWGHGGYYSPSTYINVGATLNFLSEEAKPFVYKGRLAAGYTYSKEDSAPFFPSSTTVSRADLVPGYYYDDRGSRLSASGQLFGVYQVNRHFQVGGGVSFSIAPDYNEYAGMLFLRFFFRPRAAAFSTDLADQTLFRHAF